MSKTQKYLVCFIFIVALAFSLTSCSYRLGDFTIISTKNYNATLKYKMVGRFEGKDSVFVLFGIPFGQPNIENAVDEAIEKGNGVYLTNAVLEIKSGLFSMGYNVKGDVYAEASESDLTDLNAELFELILVDNEPILKNEKRTVVIDYSK
ncbi:MAG: hypothetical protein WBC70_16795 [Candidatus Aminicenantales bacterium]